MFKGPSKRGHIVAGTLLPMMFLGLRKLGNICCGHKMFLNKIRNIFCVPQQCCTRRQTRKHLCRQQCVRNNVSSFARALKDRFNEHRRTIDNPDAKSEPTTAAKQFLSSPNHTANDMQLISIEKTFPNRDSIREAREAFFNSKRQNN